MPTVAKSVLVPHSAERMFQLVDAVEDYPQFLPWCSGTKLIERTGELTRARIDIDYHGLRTSFSTRNRKQAPEWMELELEEGPSFERLQGRWTFTALGEEGTRVELKLEYLLASRSISAVLAPVFGRILETLVDSFVERAQSR